MKESILIGIGAFVGAIARNILTNWMESVDPSFAWGTLAVNVTGSLLIGAFYTLIANGLVGEYPYKHFVVIGFCGAYTTVSSYAWQTVALLRAVAGFTAGGGIHTISLVDATGKLPLVVQFVDSTEHIGRVLPEIREMVRERLITIADIEVLP